MSAIGFLGLIATIIVLGYIPSAYICARFIKRSDERYINLLKKVNWLHMLPPDEQEVLQNLYMATKCAERIWAAEVKDALEELEELEVKQQYASKYSK